MVTGLNRTVIMLLLAAAAVGGAYVYGRSDGAKITEARLLREISQRTAAKQAELDRLGEIMRAQSAELAAWRDSQGALAVEAEDAARADPGAASRRPDDASRMRLKARWRSAP